MNLATFLHGDLEEIANYLDTTEDGAVFQDLQAVITNLCRRVKQMEVRHAEIDRELEKTAGD